MSIKRVFGLVLMVVMVCLLTMAFSGCEVSVGDPNDLPQFWPDGFVEKDGDTYHVTNGKLAKGMKVVEKRVYHFDEETGVMTKNEEVDGYQFGEEGYMIADEVFFELNGDTYYIEVGYGLEAGIPSGAVHSLAGKGINTVGALLDTDAFKTITSGRYDIDNVLEVNGIPIAALRWALDEIARHGEAQTPTLCVG